MKRVLLLASALACFSGCVRPGVLSDVQRREDAPEMARDDRMRSMLTPWVGRDIHKAIERFGPPSQRYENGETVLYMWRLTGASNVSGFWWRGAGSASAWTNVCDFQFAANEADEIVSWRWQGSC